MTDSRDLVAIAAETAKMLAATLAAAVILFDAIKQKQQATVKVG